MKNDPISDLERQLRGAVRRRAARHRFALSRRASLILVTAALVGSGVAAAAGVLHRGGPSAVAQALNAGEDAKQGQAACHFNWPKGRVLLVAGSADPRVKEHYAIFRRPTAASDRLPHGKLARGLSDRIIKSTIRVAHATDGARFEVWLSRGPHSFGLADPVGCAQISQRAAVAYALQKHPETVARVQRIEAGRVGAMQRNTAASTQTLTLVDHSLYSRAGGSGGTTLIRAGRVPLLGGWRSDTRNGHRIKVFFGLLPDKVKTVRLVDHAGLSVRPRPLVQRVHDNVYDLELAGHVGHKLQLQLRDERGSVVRVVHLQS